MSIPPKRHAQPVITSPPSLYCVTINHKLPQYVMSSYFSTHFTLKDPYHYITHCRHIFCFTESHTLCKWDLSQHTIQSVTPVKARNFLFTKICPDWPWVSPNLLQGVPGPLPGVKQPGHGADHNHPGAEVRSRAIHLLPFCTFMTGYRRNLLSPQHYVLQAVKFQTPSTDKKP